MNVLSVPAAFRPEVQNALFRRLLQAMAYPGEVQPASDLLEGGDPAVAVLAALIDDEVTYSDPHGLLNQEDLGFLTSTPETPAAADYILANAAKAPAFEAKNGTIYRPEESATVILRLQSLSQGKAWSLQGPGIETANTLRADPALQSWLDSRERLGNYPQGIDLILCDATDVVALPRTTQIREQS
jgi:alpha-D-ribose 1-methylphosphonate 5-triphosphate synthase subunit PhnH